MSIPIGRPRDSLVKFDPPLELGPAPTEALRKGAKALKPNSLKAQLSRKTQLPPAESKPNTDDVLHALLPPRDLVCKPRIALPSLGLQLQLDAPRSFRRLMQKDAEALQRRLEETGGGTTSEGQNGDFYGHQKW
eukprot:s129_g13.t1